MLLWFYDQGKQQFETLYYKIANWLGGSRSKQYAPIIGIGVSMTFAILCCVTAAKMENGILESIIYALLTNQVGPSRVKYAIHFARGVIGLGNIGGVLSVHEVGRVSERGGSKTSWFQDTLNKSHLDKYYWTLAWLSVVNLGVYILMVAFYRYRKSELVDDQEAPTYDETIGLFEDDALCCCC
ncbi:hypothetical protein Acr_15g0008350 [Actinidia rufa]|uniref:Major facilitator superfamily protein n=1 Tax=Actinidia rufa TaxID=165716 RepID=A0A7J0FUV8_9ERIC|nr:hypothetical protein Acr_15g0008350 [Actinidia rufa]